MISDSARISLQLRYGDVFSTVINKEEVFFRALTLSEYKQIIVIVGDDAASVDIEDKVVQTAVVHPALNIDKMKAGHVTALAEEILKISGFTDELFLKGLLHEARLNIDEASYMMKAFVLAAMPAYTEEDLEELTLKQLLRKVALAEKIITVQQATMGIPEEYSVRFAIGSDPDAQESVVNTPHTRRSVDKESLIEKFRSTEGEMSGKAMTPTVLEKFDEESLTLMMGVPKPNDPFAEKLHKAMGG